MKKIVLSLLMENNAGVLSRIAGLFSRRGYNIDSITAGETTTPGVTRMTVVASGEVRNVFTDENLTRTYRAANVGNYI